MTVISGALPFNRHDIRMALYVTRREVRDSFRDWRIIIPIIILTLVFPALANFTAQRLFDFTQQYGAELIGDRLVPFLLLVVGFFPMSFSLVIALETFVGEKERKSLEPLLATPLTNTQLYFGKMLAAIIPPMTTSYMGIVVYLVGLAVTIGWVIPLELFCQILLLSTLQGIVMVAAAVIISSQTTSVRAANLLASFIIVPTALLLQFEAVVMFWGNNKGLWWLVLALIVTAILLIRMGVNVFSREELLGRDIDQLRLGWMFRLFWSRLTGRADGRFPSPWAWYRQTISIAGDLRQPAFILILSFFGAILFGAILNRLYPLPAQAQGLMTAENMVENLSSAELLLSRLPTRIFIQNLRAIAVAAILGIFTFGVMDILIFMLPWSLISYLATQLSAVGENPFLFVLATVMPHGVVELSALIIVTAAGLRWHASVLAPSGNRSLSDTWLVRAADFLRVLVGLAIPLLIVAAFIEATVTPAVLFRLYGS
jgi:uncharacterized membrane protein SpoIIM required for sporulation